MTPDADLLRRYVIEKSEPAFTELVQCHLGLVYSVALRRVGGDTHLAEDVTQKVFCDLARKAPTLLARPTLGGWLYASANVASAAVVRSERRRKARETAADSMQSTLSSSEAEPDWTRLRPVIDDLVVALKAEDREAIALRFFEKRSFAEIGAALSVTEEAARKRVDRTLDRLRALLARRGVTSTTAALGLSLGAIGAATAPTALGGKVAAQALASAAISTSIVGTIAGTLWPAAAVLLLGGVVFTWQSKRTESLRHKLAQATADHAALIRLRGENNRLGREIAALSVPPTPALATSLPSAEMSPAPRPIAARITISPQGTIAWNDQPVSLGEFIAHLRTLQVTADPGGRVHIRAVGAEFLPLTYVIDEVRKAQLNHVTIESTAKANPALHPGWFWF